MQCDLLLQNVIMHIYTFINTKFNINNFNHFYKIIFVNMISVNEIVQCEILVATTQYF